MTRAIVTGASGFIGRALTRHLRQTGYQVVGLSRQQRQDSPECTYLSLPRSNDADALAETIAPLRPSVIFHLAGATTALDADSFRADVDFTRALLLAAATLRPAPRILLAGSAAELGPIGPDRLPAREDTPCHPVTPYGASKLAQTELGLRAAETGLPVIVARLFNVIGPGMPPHLAFGRFVRCLSVMAEKGGVLRTGDLSGQRDFVALTDVVRILEQLSLKAEASGKLVNICTGHATLMEPLVRELIRVSDCPVDLEIEVEKRGVSTVDVMVGDPTRLRSFGLSAAVPDFTACLTEMWKAARGQTANMLV